MVAVHYASTTLLLALLLFLPPVVPKVTAPSPMTDASALLLLKSSFTNATALSSWSASSLSLPCDGPTQWLGVACNNVNVVGLRLSGLGLSGSIDVAALSLIKGLRTISLNNNSFSGPLPPALGSLGALKSLFLSHNHFSGPIPDDLFSGMRRLKKLWLDHNHFSGPIPSSLSNARSLIELRLDNNGFEGAIPALEELHSLATFDVSNNHLSGPVPAAFARFNTSFAGNQGLCGPPMDSNPCLSALPIVQGIRNKNVSIAVATLFLVFVMLLGVYVGVRKERQTDDFDKLRVASSFGSMEALSITSPLSIGGSSSKLSGSSKSRKRHVPAGVGAGGESTDLVVVNDEKGTFRLSELMKANAEVLGNGGLGSTYKAVMSNHLAVAVKRMRDMNRTDNDGFDSQMRRLGALRHPNVLTPLAYHYRREEKLIISEYVPKGSLMYILHGDRGRDHEALDWMTRVRIARGIARGLAHLHMQLADSGEGLDAKRALHGNMKSGNILLREDFEPMLADFGFEGLVNAAQAATTMFAYKSPEGQQHRRVSAKSDVFCLGVVLLELITGKFPSQYLNNTRGGTDVVQWATSALALAEERELELVDQDMAGAKQAWGDEMVRFLKLGVTCTEVDLEKRPEIGEVAELLEEIAATVGIPPGHEGAAAALGASPLLLTDELINLRPF